MCCPLYVYFVITGELDEIDDKVFDEDEESEGDFDDQLRLRRR